MGKDFNVWEELNKVDEQEQILNEMARVGFMGALEIWIRTDDPGNIPHFHIWDKNSKGQSFHTCVKIEKAEYFHHTGKEGILNTAQRKDLCEFLKSQCAKNIRYKTNWEYLVSMWNDNNPNAILSENIEMPDYTQLK